MRLVAPNAPFHPCMGGADAHTRTRWALRWAGCCCDYHPASGGGPVGYPQAHEDDAERAVRAGLAVVKAVSGLTLLYGQHRPRLRIGIATGLVVVGE
jgi:hypothetical protein